MLTRFLACLLGSLMVATCAASDPQPPNVILILADDLGYETLGANGGTSYRTPNLDKLAAEGVRFDRCYVQPLCTPTRIQLMTGAYNIRNYVRFGILDTRLKTFGNLFESAGYRTGIFGKWQLGQAVELPKHFGFEEHGLWQLTRRPPRYANPGLEINGIEKDYSNGEYGPDLLNALAMDYITRHRHEKFFLYYPLTLTHAPYQATPDSEQWDPKAIGEKVNVRPEHFKDMVEYMDKLLGQLFTKLDDLGLRENTLILFVGDNGTGKGTRSQMGDATIVGGKGTTTIRGMHVPCIARWPKHAAKGKVCSDLVDSTDFLPTLCQAAQIPIPETMPIDGTSFLPQIRGEQGHPREWIYSWYSPRQNNDRQVREFAFDHRYKLYRNGNFFDLDRDPTEMEPMRTSELSGSAAQSATKLRGVLDRFQNARPAELDRVVPESSTKDD